MVDGDDGVRYFARDELVFREDIPGAEFWAVSLERASLTRYRLAPHTRFERHVHDSEQITHVLLGELYFEFDDRLICVHAGAVVAIPPGVPHAVVAGAEEVVAVDAWSPPIVQ